MKQPAYPLVGICGLYCGTCPRYLAYRDQDREELEKMAQAAQLPIEDIRCDGCLSDHVYPTCRDCRHGFRTCAAEKKVTWCFQCPEFPCKRLEDFSKIHRVNGIWHHRRVVQDLQFMKDHGTEEWLKSQEKEGACPHCGKMLYWHALECPRCGIPARKE